MMKKLAKILSEAISVVMSPLAVPSYGIAILLFTTSLAVLPAGSRWVLVAMTFVFTGLIPLVALAILLKLGMISDMDVEDRTQRLTPYIIALMGFMAGALFLGSFKLPPIVPGVLWGGALALGVQMIVNNWWKISAHAAGCGSLVSVVLCEALSHQILVIQNIFPIFVIAVAAAGLTGSARLLLGKHTLGQVLAGFANGFICIAVINLF